MKEFMNNISCDWREQEISVGHWTEIYLMVDLSCPIRIEIYADIFKSTLILTICKCKPSTRISMRIGQLKSDNGWISIWCLWKPSSISWLESELCTSCTAILTLEHVLKSNCILVANRHVTCIMTSLMAWSRKPNFSQDNIPQ